MDQWLATAFELNIFVDQVEAHDVDVTLRNPGPPDLHPLPPPCLPVLSVSPNQHIGYN